MALRIVSQGGYDGYVTSINLPDDTQKGDFLIACITAVPEDLPPDDVDPRWSLFGTTANGLIYWGFVGDDLSPIPVNQNDFAGLNAGHTLVIYRGIKEISSPEFRYAVRDNDVPGGPAFSIPATPPAGNDWHGAIAGVVIHTRGAPGPARVEPDWVNDATTYTPFWGPSTFRYSVPEYPHTDVIPSPHIWVDASVSDFQIVVLFGFILFTGLEATRQYPRDDQYGVIGGPRLWPPPRSGRVSGGRHL